MFYYFIDSNIIQSYVGVNFLNLECYIQKIRRHLVRTEIVSNTSTDIKARRSQTITLKVNVILVFIPQYLALSVGTIKSTMTRIWRSTTEETPIITHTIASTMEVPPHSMYDVE